jgi:outer membrane protein
MRPVFLALFAPVCVLAQQTLHLTLKDAEQLALKNNPVIAQSQFEAQAYDEVTREFRSAYYPSIQANVTAVGADSGSRLAAGALNNPIVYDRVAAGLSVSQLISDFGRTRDTVKSAALAAEAQREAVNYTRAELLLKTDGAYFAVLRARSLLLVAQETVKARQAVVDQVNALFQSKLKSSLDLSFANVNLADAKLMLSTAENDLRGAEAQIARLLVLPMDTRFDLARPGIADTPPPEPGTLEAQALQRRPDLAAQRLQLQSSEKFAAAERALSRPTVSALGTAGYVPAGESQIPGTYGAVGLNVSIPVLNGGLFRTRRFEADLRAAAKQKALENYTLQVRRDIQVAALDARNAYEKLGLTRQLLEEASLALNLAQARYKLGLSSIVELSQSQLQYTSAEISHARAEYDYAAQLSILNFQAGNVP